MYTDVYQNVTKHISICVYLLSQVSHGSLQPSFPSTETEAQKGGKKSGISPEMTETKQALEFIIEHEDFTEQAHMESSEKTKQKDQKEREDVWKKAMESGEEGGRKRGAQMKVILCRRLGLIIIMSDIVDKL